MSKEPSEDLFQLIQSMNRSEKKYFKRFSERHSHGKDVLYTRLFDAIGKLNTYEEGKFIKNNPSIAQKHFADQKQKLHQLILRSSVNYHYNSSVDLEIYHQLEAAQLLIRKRIFSQAKKVIRKSLKKALHYERFALALELLGLERQFILFTTEPAKAKKELNELREELSRVTRIFTNANEYKKLSEEMYFILTEERFLRSKKNKLIASGMIKGQLLREPRLALSVDAQLSFNRAHGFYAYMTGDMKKFYENNLDILQLIKQFPYLLVNPLRAQITAYQNILVGLKNMKEFEKATEMLNEFRQVEVEGPEQKAEIFQIATDIQLTLYLDTGNFASGSLIEMKLKNDLEKFKLQVPTDALAIIYFNMAYILTAAGKFKNAVQWVGRIINDKNFPAPADASSMARLLSLLLSFELNDFDYLEYCLKPASNFITKNKKAFPLEKALFRFFKKAIDPEQRKQLPALYQSLYKDLRTIEKNPAQKMAFNYFDFLSWGESKMKGLSFEEVVKSKL